LEPPTVDQLRASPRRDLEPATYVPDEVLADRLRLIKARLQLLNDTCAGLGEELRQIVEQLDPSEERQ
jgi:hypothetical protein